MRARSRSAQTPRSLATRLWTRVCTGRSEYGRRSIESEYTAFQFGYDRQIQPGLRAGGALSYRDGSNDIASGKGDSSIAAFTSYATKLFDNGAFLDGTFKFGRTDNEFDIASEAGRAKGDYDANMFSFSIEAGHRFHPVACFFVEPQVEFMYGRVESVDYTTSAGYTVKQDAAESFIGRAGFMTGMDLPNHRGNLYVRASVLHDWKGDADKRTPGRANRAASPRNSAARGMNTASAPTSTPRRICTSMQTSRLPTAAKSTPTTA